MICLPKHPFPRQLFEQLTKAECGAFIEVLHYVIEADTTAEVKDALSRFQNLFPFPRVISGLARLTPKGHFDGFTNVINVSYPDEWLYLYWKNGFADVDPVFKSALHFPGTQHWQTVYQDQNLSSEKELAFIATAQQFGLRDGITTGSVDQACRLATFCSFASDQAIDGNRFVPLVEYLGYYVHMALLRTAPQAAPKSAQCINELTSREVTILNWMKNGKTNWEIGKILGVSERTIRFHIESIFNKLNVTSRSQAVATAIEHGLPALHGLPSAS